MGLLQIPYNDAYLSYYFIILSLNLFIGFTISTIISFRKEKEQETNQYTTTNPVSTTKTVYVPLRKKEEGEVTDSFNKVIVTASDRDKGTISRIKRFGWG